jgi:hypothetical protein
MTTHNPEGRSGRHDSRHLDPAPVCPYCEAEMPHGPTYETVGGGGRVFLCPSCHKLLGMIAS